MHTPNDSIEYFLSLSMVLTGFDRAELCGTGLVEEYYEQVVNVVGEAISKEMWGIARDLAECEEDDREEAVRRDLLASMRFGPIARNIIQLWYWGAWIQLPQDWQSQHGVCPQDTTHFTSARAYQEGFIWRLMGTHPQGAKQPGFGSWSLPPTGRTKK